MTNTHEHNAWLGAIKRCTNSNNKNYKDWGGRGIKVCKRWLKSFEAFYADMGPCPPHKVLDRINNDGDYKPSNCRWATRSESQFNRRKPSRTNG